MQKDAVKHKPLKRIREQKKEWKQRCSAIMKNLDALAVTCTSDLQLSLESIYSLINDSYFLKQGNPLVLNMTKFSSYKESNRVWYSLPFYVWDSAGLKLRLAVHANGIQSGVNTHISLIVHNLKRDIDITGPPKKLCGMAVSVSIGDVECRTKEFCDIDEEKYHDEGSIEGLICEYKFIPHQSLCDNDTLTLTVSLSTAQCATDAD